MLSSSKLDKDITQPMLDKTPLFTAVIEKKLDTVKDIFKKLTDYEKVAALTMCDDKGKNILHHAASIEKNAEIIELLCQEARAAKMIQYASTKDFKGSSAAHYAVKKEFTDNFAILTRYNANTRLENNKGITVFDIISKKHDNKELYLELMRIYVTSSHGGRAYFSTRHCEVDPRALSLLELKKVLEYDWIADYVRDDAVSHLKILEQCLATLEKKPHELKPHEIKLSFSYLNATETTHDGLTAYRAIDFGLLYKDKDLKFDGTIKKIFSNMKKEIEQQVMFSPLKGKQRLKAPTLSADMERQLIEGTFLLNLASLTKNQDVREFAELAAFAKYRWQTSYPEIQFYGLSRISANSIQGDSTKCFAASALGVSFLKLHLEKAKMDLKNFIERALENESEDNYHTYEEDFNTLRISVRNIELALLQIYILEWSIQLLDELISTDSLLKIIEYMSVIDLPAYKKYVIAKLTKGEIDECKISQKLSDKIIKQLESPFEKNGQSKIDMIHIRNISEELIALYIKNMFIVERPKEIFELGEEMYKVSLKITGELSDPKKNESVPKDENEEKMSDEEDKAKIEKASRLYESALMLFKKCALSGHKPAKEALKDLGLATYHAVMTNKRI